MTINQKLESIKKTFQEYNLDLKRINEVIEDVVKLEQSNKDLKNTIEEINKQLDISVEMINKILEVKK